MKSKEEIVDKYLKDNHGPAETYRDILKAMKEYAQQSQPSGMRWVMDEIAFLEECVRITKEGDWSTIFVKPMQDGIAKLKDQRNVHQRAMQRVGAMRRAGAMQTAPCGMDSLFSV